MVLRSLQGAAGHKMASQIAHAAPKALQKILRRSLFGVPNSGSISGSIFNGFVVDLWSFFSVLGIYANRFWMIRDIKIQSFWNRVRFSIPYPPERPNAKHQVSNFGICQDLPGVCQDMPGICQESAGQRFHPRTFLTYTGPKMPAKSQTARPQNGGAAVTGLWPPSIVILDASMRFSATFCFQDFSKISKTLQN